MLKPSWFVVALSLFSPVALAETHLGEQLAKETSPHAFKCSYQEALEKAQQAAQSDAITAKLPVNHGGAATAINGNG